MDRVRVREWNWVLVVFDDQGEGTSSKQPLMELCRNWMEVHTNRLGTPPQSTLSPKVPIKVISDVWVRV